MKKLLSMLAALGLSATAAATAVSCGCASQTGENAPTAKVDATGNVSYSGSITLDGDINNDKDALAKAYGVYDEHGNKRSDAVIVADPASQLPAKKGQKITVKVTYKIPDYNNTKDYKDTLNKNGADNKAGAKVADIDVKPSGKNPTTNPDYTNAAGTLKMGQPKQSSEYQKNSAGLDEGYDASNPDAAPVAINDSGYLVDSNGGSTDKNVGFGKRIAGLDKDGNPLKDKSGKTIYLDNDGYRIAPVTKDGKTTWHRVSNDGSQELGPDSQPDSGNKAFLPNDQNGPFDPSISNDTKPDKNIAPYETKDNKGNVTGYLDADGNPLKYDGKQKQWVKDNNPSTAPVPAPKYTDAGEYKDSANKVYQHKSESKWTLSGTVPVQMGSKAKNGSVVVGEQGGVSDNSAVALNPSDPSSHQWHTITKGKYAGMKAKLSDDGNSVIFEWPVSNKQVDDIVSGSGKKNNNPSDSSPLDKDGKINLPIGFTDGKDGTGKKINDTQKVTVTTPWDADANSSSTNPNKTTDSSLKWWIDSSMTSQALAYDDYQGTTARIYLSTALVNKIKRNGIYDWQDSFDVNISKLQEAVQGKLKLGFNAKGKNYIQQDDQGLNFLELSIKPYAGYTFSRQDNIQLDLDNSAKDGFHLITGASEVAGTTSSVDIALTKIKNDVKFVKSEMKTNYKNTVTFAVDKNAIASDVDFTIDPKVLDTKETNNGKASDIKDWNSLLVINDGFNWDKDSKTLTLKFKDGVLDLAKYSLQLQFTVKNDNSNKMFSKNTTETIVVNKATASDNEQSVSTTDTSEHFNGYAAKWSGFSTGPYVDTKELPQVTVDYAKDAKTLGTQVIDSDNIKWDGTSLSLNIKSMPTKGTYTVSVVFYLKKGFGTTKMKQSLVVTQDDGKDIDWKAGELASLSFERNDNVQFVIKAKNTNEFDSNNIDSAASSIAYVGGGDSSISQSSFTPTIKGNVVTIALNNEVKYQANKLKFILKVVDKTGSELNPEVIEIAKDEAMASHSAINWTSASSEFNDTTVKFDIKDKNLLSDVDFNSFDKGSIQLRSTDTNAGDNYTLPSSLYSVGFDGNELTITLKEEIKRGHYTFETKFKLTNGYENSKDNSTSAELTALKDIPLERNAQVELKLVDNNNIIDTGVQYEIVGQGEAIDLTNTKAISVKFDNPDYAGKIKYSYKDNIISVNMAPGQEISGGQSDIEISFGFKDFNDKNGQPYGYESGKDQSVVGYKGTIIKKEPTPGFTKVSWDNTKSTIDISTGEASFTLDKKNTGVDVSTGDLSMVEQSLDGGTTWVKLDSDGTKYTYNDGTFNVKFTDEVMHTVELHETPRQFKLFLKIGNGYENSDYAKNNPDGIPAGILTATKEKPTDFERQLSADDNSAVRDFYEPEKGGDWLVSSESQSIDWNKADVKISWTKPTSDIPWDSNKGITFKPNSDADANPEIDPDKSTHKDPNSYVTESVTDASNGQKKFHLSLANGSLWQDNYTVQLRFKLKGYDNEYSNSVTLHFTKQKPNPDELKIVPKGTKYEVTDYNPGKGATWAGRYLEIKITFSQFGGCIDPVTKPSINIWGVGATELSKQGWGVKGKLAWTFKGRTTNADGSVSFTYRTTNWGNVGSYYWSTHYTSVDPFSPGIKEKYEYDAKLEVSFVAAGFTGDGSYLPEITFHAPQS